MISFVSIKEANALDVRKVLNKYNGADVELRLNSKPLPILFLRSLVTGSTANDELTLEFIFNVSNGKELEQSYKYIRSLINKDVEVKIGTSTFYASLVDTYKIPVGVKFDDILENKFSISFNNVRNERVVKSEVKKEENGEKETSWLQIGIPDNIWDVIKRNIKHAVKDPHITVIHFNKVLEENEREKVIKVIENVCRNFGPILIKTGKTTCFGTKDNPCEVLLIDSKQLLEFNEELEQEIDLLYPDIVSKDYSYCPHTTLSYKKIKKLPYVPSIAWNADRIEYITGNAKYGFWLKKNRENDETTPCKELEKLVSKPELRVPEITAASVGYKLASSLEELGYRSAANIVKNVACSVDTDNPISKLRTIAGILFEQGNIELSNRCLASVNKIEIPIDDKIKNALVTYVDPIKLDSAINAVLEAISPKKDEKEEVEALGPGMPGTDPRIVTYTKSPQTQDVMPEAPVYSKNLELSKRISSGDIIETAARKYIQEEAASLNDEPDKDAIAFLEHFIMHTPSKEEIAKYRKYYYRLVKEEENRINDELYKKSMKWVKEDTNKNNTNMYKKVPELMPKKKANVDKDVPKIASEKVLRSIADLMISNQFKSGDVSFISTELTPTLDDLNLLEQIIGHHYSDIELKLFNRFYQEASKKLKDKYFPPVEASTSLKSKREARINERKKERYLNKIASWNPKFSRSVRIYNRGNDKVLMSAISKEFKTGSVDNKKILKSFIQSLVK